MSVPERDAPALPVCVCDGVKEGVTDGETLGVRVALGDTLGEGEGDAMMTPWT